jgi:hypothetical protein
MSNYMKPDADKIREICKKWNLTELNFTKGIFMDDNGITVDIRGDTPIVGVTISGTLHTEGHGNLRVPDLEVEIMNVLKPFLKPTKKPVRIDETLQSSRNDKKAEVKDDSHKIVQRKSDDQNNVTTRPQKQKEIKGGQESSFFKSQSTEKPPRSQSGELLGKQPLLSDKDKSKLGTPDNIEMTKDYKGEVGWETPDPKKEKEKLHKAVCKDCKAEFELTLDTAAELDQKYGGIYCHKCRDEIDKGLNQKEPAKMKEKVPTPKIKTCAVCGTELSGARALECFQKDPQSPIFRCEDCAEATHEKEHKKEETGKDAKIKERQTAEPEVIKKESPHKPPPQPDARLPVQAHTPQGIIIKGFQPSLKEIGKIKIGNKGEERPKAGGGTFRLPVKFDHFEIVSLMRDEKGDFIKDPVMKELGEAPKELDCILLFNDPTLNFITRYNQYQGGKCLCQGDGATAKQIDGAQVECNPDTCPQFTQKKCKPNGILSVILTKSPRLGGVYKFRTTSFNSIRSILSSMFFLSNLTGGVLAMIPLKLTVSPMQVQPKDSMKPQTIYVVNIEFAGTASELLQKTFEVQKYQSAMRENIIKLESTARAVLTAPESKEEIKEIEAEWYPETQNEVTKK